jgi:hypothetical protein
LVNDSFLQATQSIKLEIDGFLIIEPKMGLYDTFQTRNCRNSKVVLWQNNQQIMHSVPVPIFTNLCIL